ncbi:MAG: hypothetical protein V9H25_23390 [Candidatus Competibacter sp.]
MTSATPREISSHPRASSAAVPSKQPGWSAVGQAIRPGIPQSSSSGSAAITPAGRPGIMILEGSGRNGSGGVRSNSAKGLTRGCRARRTRARNTIGAMPSLSASSRARGVAASRSNGSPSGPLADTSVPLAGGGTSRCRQSTQPCSGTDCNTGHVWPSIRSAWPGRGSVSSLAVTRSKV